MPRGGKRTGTPGKAYGQRSDMQAPKAADTGTYGEAAALKRGQEIVPLPQAPSPGAGVAAAGMPAPAPIPGDLPLGRPTDRPGEPLTAGMARGPGAGPSAAMPAVDPVVETLRAMYRAFPNEYTGALLERMEA